MGLELLVKAMVSWVDCRKRKRWGRRALLGCTLLGCAGGLWAQGTGGPMPDAPGASKVETRASGQRVAPGEPAKLQLPAGPGLSLSLLGPAYGSDGERGGGLSFSLWDRTPFEAIERGAGRGAGFAGPRGDFGRTPSLLGSSGAAGWGRSGGTYGMSAGMNEMRGAAEQEQYLNQLTRGDLGMNLRSQMGSFRLGYQGGMSGMGPGLARTTFTSTQFNDGLFDFSSSFYFGSGSSLISTHSGFSAGVLRGSACGPVR